VAEAVVPVEVGLQVPHRAAVRDVVAAKFLLLRVAAQGEPLLLQQAPQAARRDEEARRRQPVQALQEEAGAQAPQAIVSTGRRMLRGMPPEISLSLTASGAPESLRWIRTAGS
jgi:hypothetical protein